MKIKQWFRFIIVDPVNLSIKGKLLSVTSCFVAIFLAAWVAQAFNLGSAYPIIVASMGASAVILFIIPNSPLAQPWPLVGGQLISAVAGMWSALVFSDIALASACAVGSSVLAMLLLRCLHPPGAATALTPVMSGEPITSLGYGFVLMPVGLNVAIMLMMAIVINRWVLRYDYPIPTQPSDHKKIRQNEVTQSLQHTGISIQDLDQTLDSMNMFVDVSSADLSKLFTAVQSQLFQRYQSHITCADIMDKDLISVEYGTEVEEAWKIMHSENLNAIPVIDKARRVIGIITWNDFFKFINVDPNETFQDKFRAFIRRTPAVSSDKPESVGHIMTSSVSILQESSHISDLIPLMLNLGFRQIPIVNHENRLAGMVYQADLIAGLYNKAAIKQTETLHRAL